LNNLKVGNPVDYLQTYDKYGRDMGLEPLYKPLAFNKLTISQTKNTIVTCRVCRGRGKIIHKVAGGYGIVNDCPHCNGTKVMKAV